jgi:hypothetical protein
MADPRGTLIHIGRDLSPGLDPQGATGPGQDLSLRDPDPHPAEEEVAEIARVVTEVEGGEAQVIAATAATTIGVEAEAVDAVAAADVDEGLWFYSVEFGMDDKENVLLISQDTNDTCFQSFRVFCVLNVN